MSRLFLFAVCQKGQDHMTVTYLGRIGVSLMLRYHKTHQWAKVNQHTFVDVATSLKPTNLIKSCLRT